MVILIDGDGCPDLMEVKKIVKFYSIEMIVFVDYAHLIKDDYFKVMSEFIHKIRNNGLNII